MTEQEKIIRLGEVIEDEAIVTSLSQARTKDEMQMIFANNGLEMSIEEVNDFIASMNFACADELSELELEPVSGGGVTSKWILKTAYKSVKKVWRKCWQAGEWFAENIG